MKLTSVFIAIISLAGVFSLVWWDWQHRRSPGPLHPSHAAVAELAGSSGCSQCHGSGNSVMAQACAKCHMDVQTQLDQARGLHGQLVRAAAEYRKVVIDVEGHFLQDER